MTEQLKNYAIGIDAGTHTGFAIWDKGGKKFEEIRTLRIDQALFRIKELVSAGHKIHVVVEDARKRKWFGEDAEMKQQGAGSVKRDSAIWDDFLTANNISHTMRAPGKGMTKWSSKEFQTYTGYKARTSEHARDAAMLVYQY